MNISNAQRIAWEIAEESGWHDEPRTVGDRIALMHSELSEALEDFRVGYRPDETYSEEILAEDGEILGYKPCGIGVELADCIIRIFDFAEEEGIHMDDLILLKMNHNRTRPHRHGGKVL
jgi:hypothetical protein